MVLGPNVKHVGSPKRDAQQCYIKFCVCKMLNHKCIFHKNTTPFLEISHLFLEKTPFVVIRHCAQTPHGQPPSFIVGICFENEFSAGSDLLGLVTNPNCALSSFILNIIHKNFKIRNSRKQYLFCSLHFVVSHI